jgi:hypothetical protein
VVAPLVVTPIASPNPVLGTDNLTHLAMNSRSSELRVERDIIQKVETL